MKATRICSAEGCGRPSRSRGLCRTHYSRLARTGQVTQDLRTLANRPPSGGYRTISVAGHPLAQGNGKSVYVHRFTLYAEIGPGEHPCHWCGITVTWDLRVGVGALVVDHLNGGRDDNRPANLVASCQPCNVARQTKRLRATCLKGHEYSPENTRIEKGSGKRVCRTCERVWAAAKAERRRAASATDQVNERHEPGCAMRVEEK